MHIGKTPLILIGAGGHARSLLDIAGDNYKATGYVAPHASSADGTTHLRWLGDDRTLKSATLGEGTMTIISTGVAADGNLNLRRKLIEMHSALPFATVISAHAIISGSTTLGAGSAVFHGAIINTGTQIGRHCVVNTAAVVEHDCTLGENVFVGPGAVLCGGVTIGNDVFIGANATLRQGIYVCDGTIIGMGAVVTADITLPGCYAGVPARKIK